MCFYSDFRGDDAGIEAHIVQRDGENHHLENDPRVKPMEVYIWFRSQGYCQ